MRQPSIFLGHGNPMHAIDTSGVFVDAWRKIAAELPRPKAILAISAHWYVAEMAVTSMAHPRTIHDFGGFPQALFDVEYPAPGSPELAEKVSQIVGDLNNGNRARLDRDTWGLDHGTWSVLRHMYPDADIPVIQLSIDARKPDAYHYELGRKLAALRDEGVLIFGSGNIVHNFRYMTRGPTPSWAQEFVQWIKDTSLDESIDRSNSKDYPVVHWKEHKYGSKSQMGPDHFLPVLYVLGTADQGESIQWAIEEWEMGSLSMHSFFVGATKNLI